MTKSRTYIATPPGATISELLKDRHMTQKELADRIGYSEKHISQLLNGEVPLTQQTAEKLELVLDVPAVFWVNLEAIYRDKLSKAEAENQMDEEKKIVSIFPYKEANKLGWLPEAKSQPEKVTNLRKFFEVTDLRYLEKSTVTKIACRKLSVTQKSDAALLIWAQQAKRLARDIEVSKISISRLQKQLSKIRNLCTLPPDEFVPLLKEILAKHGVALVLIPHLSGSGLHGAAFKDGNKIVLGATLRGKDADKFWFSLFHELGHICLKHIDRTDTLTEDDEKAADEFARNALIPQDSFEQFISGQNFSEESVRKFASKNNLLPGIVVGRLQNDEIIKYSQLNHLKTQYVFKSK